jgi:beta-N-acetylhexosaminidase
MSTSVRQAAGSLLVVGLSSTELSGLESAWLRLVRPAGIILFRRNIQDAAGTRSLLDSATALLADDSFRMVDVEGGEVDRLRNALAPIPSPKAVMQAAEQTGKTSLIRKHGELVAQAVKAFGFNTTLAPVIDLALSESAALMGTRAAAATAAGVVEYARHFAAGLAAHGVLGCGKHFPGLGGGTLDSHLDTPAIERSSRELWQKDLAPYRALANRLPMIMVNHASYPQTRSKNLPASISRFWITTMLRERLGYRGLIFSDDMEMGGILKFMPIEEAVVAAIRAGMDLIEICHSPELILRAFEALIAEAERSQAFHTLLLARALRARRLRSRLLGAGVSRRPTAKQLAALRSAILGFGETIAKYQPTPETPPA